MERNELAIPMVLIIPLRAYQYSNRECPQNWEAMRYEVLGPYALEPFRYFEEVKKDLSYPVLSLLPIFQNAKDFPLFLENDPHWNETGTYLAASSVAQLLIGRQMVPCRGLEDHLSK